MMDMIDLLDVAPLGVIVVTALMIGLKALLLWEVARLLAAVRCWVEDSEGYRNKD